MAIFEYTAINKKGKKKEGKLEVKNEVELKSRLKSDGYILLKANHKSRTSNRNLEKENIFSKKIGLKNKVTIKDISIFTRQISTMINSGISLYKIFRILEMQNENPNLKKIISSVREDITQGISLAQAMSKHPKYFDSLYISMVKAGEASGNLDIVFERLADKIEEDSAFKEKVKSALIYPIIVVSVAFGMVFLLMWLVIPRFSVLFQDAGIELPNLTQHIINLSEIISNYWWLIIIGMISCYYILKKIIATDKGELMFHIFLLKLPFWGEFNRKIAVARFSRTLATLLESKVHILNSFDIVSETVGNRIISKAIKESKISIKDGNSIARPLQNSGQFPIMITQMIEVGEESGKIVEMLDKAADFTEREVRESSDRMVAALEPIAIVFLSLIVGTLVLSMFLPVFKMTELV